MPGRLHEAIARNVERLDRGMSQNCYTVESCIVVAVVVVAVVITVGVVAFAVVA